MQRMIPTSLFALLSATTAAACLDTADDQEAISPTTITWHDRSYSRVDQLADTAQVPDERAALATRSRDQLADQLRAMLLHPDGVFVADDPDWATADAVLAQRGPVDRVPIERARFAPSDATPEAAVARLAAALPLEASLVIGADGRTLSPTTIAPFNAITRVEVYSSVTGGGFRMQCTGTYIGPWTFVLAGHCLRFPDGAVARRLVFETARAGSSLPFPRRDCRNGDASTSNDFVAAVPAGYTGTLDNSLDFAVIDTFPCHSAPRKFDGYSVDVGTTTFLMHGYPIGRCPGASAEGTFMCGMSGAGYQNGWRLESADIDATDGQDGAPWWTDSPTRVAGVHVGYREYFDFGRCGFDNCRRNYARRIDSFIDGFIRANAFDF
jgi:V8-like Glu-specific endopeptidase